MQSDLLDYARAQLAARHGADHPQLDEWASRAVRLYLSSTSQEVRAVVSTFPPLSASQARVLSTLLEP